MRCIVAVSGGVDSVVLLDRLVREGNYDLIVAHFDHGIRKDSRDDALFVEGLAAKYSLTYVSKREDLGENASEQLARERRYLFLRAVAKQYQAAYIVTAHHQDDIIETIAINIQRGTGWRGVAIMQTVGIVRPLAVMSKAEIRRYALEHRLEWVEDSTNGSHAYLRNRLRSRICLNMTGQQKSNLLELWKNQLLLRHQIEEEVGKFVMSEDYSRYFYICIDFSTGIEILRAAIEKQVGFSPTYPQLIRGIIAIKTARAGAVLEIGDGLKLRFRKRCFIVEAP